MNGKKIVITARNFDLPDAGAVKLLEESGFTVIDHSDKNCGTSTSEEKMSALIGDADGVITGLEPVGRKVLESCPNLKLVSRRSIGYDTVDIAACVEHKTGVARAAGTVEAAVAEQVMAYILHFARRLDIQNESMHKGVWERKMSYGAKNRTLGLIGFGGIGREIAARAVPFGMNVIYYCRHPKLEWEKEYNVRSCSFDEVLSESDYISVNVPLTDSTRHMFGEEQFGKMKPECVFINISRGQVTDTYALKKALDEHLIRGAGIDVFDSEPCTDSPLISCENAVLTPHTAPFTGENFSEMNLCAARNVINYFNGTIDRKYLLTDLF